MTQVIHLIQDRTPGGVTRMIDCLSQARALQCQHETVGLSHWRSIETPPDVLVSHLPVSWRNLPAFLAIRARFPSVRLIHVEHTYTQSFVAMNVAGRARFFSLLRTCYAVFDAVVAVSQTQSQWLRARDLVAAHSLETIESMVDLTPFVHVAPPSPQPKTLGVIGRLERQKGVDIVIKAFRRLKDRDLRLLIFGQGTQEATLRNLARSDPRVQFHGYTSEPQQAFSQVDAVLMPSRWEAYGLVADEALAASRPVLAAAVDGLKDATRQGLMRVPGHAPRLWADCLTQFVQNPSTVPPLSHDQIANRTSEKVQKWRRVLQGDQGAETGPTAWSNGALMAQ